MKFPVFFSALTGIFLKHQLSFKKYTSLSPLCPGGGMADAADLKSASLWEYGFDPRSGYHLSFYGKRKVDKEKRSIAFLKKAWQKFCGFPRKLAKEKRSIAF